MPNCAQCGKQVGFFSAKSDFAGNSFCSDECKNKFTEKKTKDKKTEKEMKSKGMLKETKCKCNQCGHVWHYLEEEEKRVKGQIQWSACGQMTCCLPLQLYSKHEGGKWEQESDKFKKCPKCGSHDIKKTAVYYEKKS